MVSLFHAENLENSSKQEQSEEVYFEPAWKQVENKKVLLKMGVQVSASHVSDQKLPQRCFHRCQMHDTNSRGVDFLHQGPYSPVQFHVCSSLPLYAESGHWLLMHINKNFRFLNFFFFDEYGILRSAKKQTNRVLSMSKNSE